MSRKRMAGAVAAAAAVAALVAGCSGGSGGSQPTGTPGGSVSQPATGGSPPATPAQPAPGATESNPAGDIPDSQAYVAYAPAQGGFTLKVPEGWGRTDSGTTVAFGDKLNRIEITAGAAASAPSVQQARAEVLPALQQQVPQFAAGTVSEVARPAGTAVLVTYQGDSAPDPVTGKVVRDACERYTFFKDGRQVVITLCGPVAADNKDPWRTVTDSLRWQ
ncbi:hypothetical protein [Kitasatospora sp. NPDC091207]|uniref:hypothetical protein n=1 Tax=Kitasatospora sp. NPDC091207 TaxID=3364083 RepID=UPI003811E987